MSAPQLQTQSDPVAAWLRALLIFLLIVISGLLLQVRSSTVPESVSAETGETQIAPIDEARFDPPELLVQRIQGLEIAIDQMRKTLFELSRGDRTESIELIALYRDQMHGLEQQLADLRAKLATFDAKQRGLAQ